MDKATAIGFALFFGIALGSWLGATLVRGINSLLYNFYRNSDANLVKAVSDLKQRFADAFTSLDAVDHQRLKQEEGSGEALVKFSSSVNAFRELARIISYIYPIVAVFIVAESLTVTLLSIGGVATPAIVSLFALVVHVLFVGLFSIYLLTFLSGLQLMNRTRKLIEDIHSLEQLVAAKKDGNIEEIIPDMSALRKAVSVPPLVVSRLAA